MELGNLIYGNSRGEFEVERDWNDIFCELTYYIAETFYNTGYGIFPFDCEKFTILPYQWDCACEDEHKLDCLCLAPNFLYKPTGFMIKWYKYPFRDSYMNQQLTKAQFKEMIMDCLQSIKN